MARALRFCLGGARRGTRNTQAELAAALAVEQQRVAELEEADIDAVSFGTVRRYIAALGGHIELVLPGNRWVRL
jgi:predicted XRE-type DNA-binding protein